MHLLLPQSPTISPTPLPYCPDQYDRTKTDYVVGDQASDAGFVFECQPYPYEPYCNKPDFLPSMLKEDANAKLLWMNAWSYVSECYRTETPTMSPTTSLRPSTSPTELPSISANPTIALSSVPSQVPSSLPSLAPTPSPTLHPTSSPSLTVSSL